MKQNFKNLLLGVLAVGIYFIGTSFEMAPLELLHLHPENWSSMAIIIYSLAYESFLILLIVLLFLKEIKKMFLDYRKHIKTYLRDYIPYWFLALALMFMSNLILNILIPQGTAENEETVRSILDSYPIYGLITCIVLAPILEELVFRFSIRKMCFKIEPLFITLSGIVFGLLHVIGSSSLANYLYIIPYGIPGFIFAYTLVKSDNIFVPISLHAIHNGIITFLQLLL